MNWILFLPHDAPWEVNSWIRRRLFELRLGQQRTVHEAKCTIFTRAKKTGDNEVPFEANFLGWSITSCIFWLPITKLDRKPHSAISWWWWGWKRMMTSGGLWAPWVRRTWSFDYDGTQRSRWLFSFSCWFIFLNTILELLTFRDNYGIMRATRRRASCGYEKYLA